MAVFTYQGRSAGGIQNGEIEAAGPHGGGRRAAQAGHPRHQDRREGGRQDARCKVGGKVKDKELAIFTRQFSTMIDAGLPLVQCLNILAEQSESKNLRGRHRRRSRATSRRARRWPTRSGSTRAPSTTCSPTWSRSARRAVSSTSSCSASPSTSRRPPRSSGRSSRRMVYPVSIIGVALHGRRLHADLRHPDLRQDVQGAGRRAAAADARSSSGCRTSCAATSCSSSRRSSACVFALRAYYRTENGRVHHRRAAAQGAGLRHADPQGRRGPLHPHPRHAGLSPACPSSRACASPRAPPATRSSRRPSCSAAPRSPRARRWPSRSRPRACSRPMVIQMISVGEQTGALDACCPRSPTSTTTRSTPR